MKSKIASFIMSFIMILIILLFVLLGFVLWQNFEKMQTSVEPENFQGNYTTPTNTLDTNTIKTPKVQDNPFNEISSVGSGESQNIDYSNVQVDNYFFEQLSEESKTIYRALESNKENMRSGTYRIDFGNDFSDILNTSNGQDELGRLYQSAIEAFTYDNPEVFYLSPNKMYLNIETTTYGNNRTYNVFINNGNESSYLIDEFSNETQVNQAIEQIESVKNTILSNRTGNSYDDIRMVHDYLVENIEYDTTISQSNIYNVYGALVNGRAVCEGYARSFKYLMDELGIPCTLVIGTGTNSQGQTENHAWNYVQLNGNWYAIDCTWDDPVSSTGYVSQSSKYRYFLKGSSEFLQDHTPSGQFTEGGKVFSYPTLSRQGY